MATGSETLAAPADRALVMSRVFDAPRSLVFKAWTEREHMSRWCAPAGFTITHSEGDIRPGGAWRSCMRSPDGVDHWVSGVYREIVQDKRLVFTHAWDGEDGKPGHETLVTITFEDQAGKTKMNFHQAVFKSSRSRDGHEGGWAETFDRLEEYLKKLQSKENHND
jgi:uncharacterized protein YndB with AHSA1/START domain